MQPRQRRRRSFGATAPAIIRESFRSDSSSDRARLADAQMLLERDAMRSGISPS